MFETLDSTWDAKAVLAYLREQKRIRVLLISFRAHTTTNFISEADRAQFIAIDPIFVELIPHTSITLKHSIGYLIHFTSRFITKFHIVVFKAKPFLLWINILAIIFLLSGLGRVLGLEMTLASSLTQITDQVLFGSFVLTRSFLVPLLSVFIFTIIAIILFHNIWIIANERVLQNQASTWMLKVLE